MITKPSLVSLQSTVVFKEFDDPKKFTTRTQTPRKSQANVGAWPECFVEPCPPSPAKQPQQGEWIHEIKHDGFPHFEGNRVIRFGTPGIVSTQRGSRYHGRSFPY
jgi:hypothetical protein